MPRRAGLTNLHDLSAAGTETVYGAMVLPNSGTDTALCCYQALRVRKKERKERSVKYAGTTLPAIVLRARCMRCPVLT
eukprot:1310991-Rhodomonas_salina.2